MFSLHNSKHRLWWRLKPLRWCAPNKDPKSVLLSRNKKSNVYTWKSTFSNTDLVFPSCSSHALVNAMNKASITFYMMAFVTIGEYRLPLQKPILWRFVTLNLSIEDSHFHKLPSYFSVKMMTFHDLFHLKGNPRFLYTNIVTLVPCWVVFNKIPCTLYLVYISVEILLTCTYHFVAFWNPWQDPMRFIELLYMFCFI